MIDSVLPLVNNVPVSIRLFPGFGHRSKVLWLTEMPVEITING